MTFLLLILFALVGIVAGLIGGLLGISGGLITVPSLLFLFTYMDFPTAYVMHSAIGTSLASMVITSYASAKAHNTHGGVIRPLVKKLIPGLILGSILGAFIARKLTSTSLQYVFGLFVILLGIYLLLSRPKQTRDAPHLPPGPLITVLGFLIAALSNILGLGGGSMVVPTLLAFRVTLRRAIGTSAVTGLIITTIGALSYLSFGYRIETTPLSLGYLYIPAFIMISVATFIAAPYGAKLTHHLPSPLLRRLFAVTLIATGVLMLFK